MIKDSVFLYVEDDAPSRKLMRAIMQSIGVEKFNIFENGRDFLTRLKGLEEKPTVFLLDIQMKPYDGFHLLKLIRDEPGYADAIVIALTASVMHNEVQNLKENGFDAAIAKPLRFRIFPDLLQRILNRESVWHIS